MVLVKFSLLIPLWAPLDVPARAVGRVYVRVPKSAPGGSIVVGSRVRVKPSVANPKHGWGSVKHGHVGIVKPLEDGGEKMYVDFPSHSGWAGRTAEMELA